MICFIITNTTFKEPSFFKEQSVNSLLKTSLLKKHLNILTLYSIIGQHKGSLQSHFLNYIHGRNSFIFIKFFLTSN